MDKLIETHQRLLAELKPSYGRRFYETFSMDSRMTGIIGPRGVGKTTFLLHYLRTTYKGSDKALYVSADNLFFTENTLLKLADDFVKLYDGKMLCIDEVHKYKNWNQELKNIYDSYPGLNILFSGSSSIDLIKGKYDLSRRVVLRKMNGFSFREYLEIRTGKKLPIISFRQLLKPDVKVRKLGNIEKLLGHFKAYLKCGYYPTFTLGESYETFREKLINVIDKTVFEDISSFYSLKTDNLDILKKILYFFATSTPGSINVNKLAKNLQKDNVTIAGYLQMLRDTGLLRFLLSSGYGHAVLRHAEKIYLDNTNLLYSINETIGKKTITGVLRELFVIQALENANLKVLYSPKGDVICNDIVFEIGGKSKGESQISEMENGYVIKDDILFPSKSAIPLYLFGFLS